VINFKARNKLYVSNAYRPETKEAAQGIIEDIKKSAVKSSGEKYELGCKLLEFYNSKSYASRSHDNDVRMDYGHYLSCNAHSAVFFAVCEIEFGLDKSEVSRLMNVVDEFGKRDKSKGLIEKYKAYKWSVLVELLSMSPEERELVTPDMTVKQVRDLKKKLVATSQQKDDEEEDPVPVREEPERFKKCTRLQLIDYIESLEERIRALHGELPDESEVA